MQVSGWKHRGFKSDEIVDGCPFGLNLGAPNRDEYFDGLTEAKVEINGKIYVFSLARSNFRGPCPELRDEDLLPGQGTPIRTWLEDRGWLRWPKGKPPYFELVPLGKDQFRLESMRS